MLEKLRSMLGIDSSNDREEVSDYPPVMVVASPELVEPSLVPPSIIQRMWSVLEKDAALTFLDDREIKWLQFHVELLAEIATVIQPEVPHPEIIRVLKQGLREWLDEENAKLLGYLRLKRSWRGMERRLQTVQAPIIARRGW